MAVVNLCKKLLWSSTTYLFPSRVFVTILLSELPGVAESFISLFFIGQIPDASALALASQYEFISILLEIIEDGVINSLFNYIGKHYTKNRPMALLGLKISLLVLVLGGTILGAIVYFWTNEFVSLIDTPATLVQESRDYLQISAFSFPIILASKGLLTYLYISESKIVIATQISYVVASFGLNFFLFGQHTASARWGKDSLGHFKLISQFCRFVLTMGGFFLVEKIGMINFLMKIPFQSGFWKSFKEFGEISWAAFAESLIQNGSYFLVILTFMNSLGEVEIGAWYLGSNLIWSVLIFPILAICQYVKVQVGHIASSPQLKTHCVPIFKKSMVCMILWLIILGVVSGLLWESLAKMFSPNNVEVQVMSKRMVSEYGWGYILFSFTSLGDSFIFGIGKTNYILIKIVLSEVTVSLIPYLLYLSGNIVPSYYWVIGLALSGYVVQFVIALIIYGILWRNLPNDLDASEILD